MNYTQISSSVWSSAEEILKGVFKPHEYGRIILPFIVFRRLDCVLEPVKDQVYDLYEKYKVTLSDPSPAIENEIGFPFYNRSRFDLIRLKTDPDNIEINFNNYIHGYSSNVIDIIENFQIAPLIKKLHDYNRLYQLINKFTEFDLHPAVIDNHQMGSIYEDLLRGISSMSNEKGGEHYTPRDVVKLLVTFVFGGVREDLQGEGKVLSVYDPCCGTGGILTIGKNWVLKNINPSLQINLFGQELNRQTYSICKSDLLMLEESAENIHGPCSSLSDDRLPGKQFDFMITIPPFGMNWKLEKGFISEESKDPNGRFSVGTPRVSDSSLLFLQHLIHKMNSDGSRIGIVFNASSLFTGDAGSGESEIRKWIIENDWLETIVRLPNHLFFNTGITTYFWIVTNRKSEQRKGKVQLIDGASFYQLMKKSVGYKRKEITDMQLDELARIYTEFSECENSKIFTNNELGYTRITINRPLYDEERNQIAAKNGKVESTASKTEFERVPLTECIEQYSATHLKPHYLDSWMDRSKDRVGYEINFNWKIKRSISKLSTDYAQYPTVSLESISKQLNFTNSEFKHAEGVVYVPLVGRMKCESNLSGVRKRHQNFCQINLDQSCVRAKYLLQYLNSELGQKKLNLAQLECGALVIPRLTKKKIRSLQIALPPIEIQQQIEETAEKLSKVSDSINSIRHNLSQNPITSKSELTQLDRIADVIHKWSAADEIKMLAKSDESKHLEFKETFSWNIHSKQKDRQIENAVIKSVAAFLNTEGGDILVGVDDYGRIKGLELEIEKLHKNRRDKFFKHVDNLLQNRIGVSFSQFYGIQPISVDELTVLRISCVQSNRQVFVNDSEFYVRTSPATHQLKGQELIDYVNTRFGA